jgi:2-dehydro-3-deoxyphosphogalactonate aldolase
VGGVGADAADEWLKVGVDGFGIGSEIYKPGYSAEQVYQSAAAITAAITAVKGS